MDVTGKMVGDVIAECFTTDSYVRDDFIRFYLDDDEYIVEVRISLYEVAPETDTEPARQGMQVLMWLCDLESERLNLAKIMPFSELLVLCNRLQDSMDWGTILPYEIDSETINLGVVRTLDITTRDLSCAINNDMNSEFLRVVHRLGTECDELFVVVQSMTGAGITTFSEAKLLLTEPHGRA
jgi:hypothetical protein